MIPAATIPPTVDFDFLVAERPASHVVVRGGRSEALGALGSNTIVSPSLGRPGCSMTTTFYSSLNAPSVYDSTCAFRTVMLGGGYASTVDIGPDPVWSFALSEAAARVRELRDGWDGPGSKAVANHVLFTAETLVRKALDGRRSATAPYLVPAGDGSVQIEWHERQGEIELSIDRNGEIYVWGRNHQSGQEFDGEGAAALDLFARWAPRLATEAHDVGHVPLAAEEARLEAA